MSHPSGPIAAPRQPEHPAGRELRLWLLSLALAAPAFLPYASHFAAPPAGRIPTGFIAYDMPYYMANAREHFDEGHFRLLYSNPFDPRYESPTIYFQPMTLALGAAYHGTGAPPGVLFVLFELLAAWVCARVALSLYFQIVGLGDWPRRVGLLAFFWGGGALTITAIVYSLLTHGTIERIFRFDPSNGWWFLNFGRNLVLPTEALYHAIFFGSVLCILRQRFILAAVLAFLLSASHPFSGVELLLILFAWSALELFFVKSRAVPQGFFVAIVSLLALHVGYYLVYLSSIPEHTKLMKAWAIAWELDAVNFVPAYALVGVLAFWSFRRLDIAKQFFSRPHHRLFLTWFIVAFALANHEFAIRPIQPLHFTRGYIWTPLFFMGVMPLVGLFGAIQRLRGIVFRNVAAGAVLAALLLDNAAWLAQYPLKALAGRPDAGITITHAQLDLFRWLCRDENRGALLLTGDRDLGYLASVYTPLRSWIGHIFNTPDGPKHEAEIQAFLAEGRLVDAWSGKTLLVVTDGTTTSSHSPATYPSHPTYTNDTYLVYRLDPAQTRALTRLPTANRLDVGPTLLTKSRNQAQ
jgi:hypothetical protein